ncbi:putative exported protein [Halobacteriovorax marinus SJ]|uniref:Exported protein n=1 Tax=Halobacteriovorax marinus (strain ATCC BAA-682 / DSM 15412 / SJ) TaxID=862908 RepID=E1WYS0_HALMS|nr:Fic family protein [Halobacteriovorax marinus]CBW27710.1 putative exported protein [Halobacteriovorax marinus SJ]
MHRNLIFTLLVALTAFGCTHNSTFYSVKSKPKNYVLRYPAAASESCKTVVEQFFKSSFSDRRERLMTNISNFDETERIGITNAIESIHFIDYNYTVKELDQVFKGHKELSKVEYPYAFNKGRREAREVLGRVGNFLRGRGAVATPQWDEAAFENFVDARKYLIANRPDYSLETFKEVHTMMMKNGVEEIKDSELGAIRKVALIGNERGRGVTDEALENINSNPYLGFQVTSVTTEGEVRRSKGAILYPTPSNIKDEALARIETTHPETFEKITAFKEGDRSISENDLMTTLVEALTEERFSWFNETRRALGSLDTEEKINDYIEMVVNFQRDMVSIHPFRNGNGRTTREFILNYALIKEGLPPSRIADPNMDLYSPIEVWREQVVKGMESTNSLYEDITNRLELNLPVENSPELFSPYTIRSASIDAKKYSSKAVKEDARVADVDPRQYMEFVSYMVDEDPSLIAKIEKSPHETLLGINKKYESFLKTVKVDFTHKKEGLQEVNLAFVDRDFKATFGEGAFRNSQDWDAKMALWYQDSVVWRGLAYRRDVEESEILKIFREIHPQMTSNDVAKKIRGNMSQKQMKEIVLADFDRYNDDLYHGGLVQMAKDHSETGPQYGTSYGYSTSKDRKVGKAFAMGAMQFQITDDAGKRVQVTYGMQNDPDVIEKLKDQLKGRVLIGVRRANKDVDLGRLKQVRPEFSYKYGRQQEVMGIGAADPDSVMVVQILKDDGDIAVSYFRNPKNPSELLVVKDPKVSEFEEVTEEMITRRINIE